MAAETVTNEVRRRGDTAQVTDATHPATSISGLLICGSCRSARCTKSSSGSVSSGRPYSGQWVYWNTVTVRSGRPPPPDLL